MISDSTNLDEKNLNSPNRIDIYSRYFKSSFRHKSAKDNHSHFDPDTGKIRYIEKAYTPQKNRLNERRRILSHKNIKYSNIIISDIDANDEQFFSPQKMNYIQRTPTFKSIKSTNKNEPTKNNRYRKKKVHFKHKFVNIIEVESYKKYNINNGLYDNANAKCTCIIY